MHTRILNVQFYTEAKGNLALFSKPHKHSIVGQNRKKNVWIIVHFETKKRPETRQEHVATQLIKKCAKSSCGRMS